MLLATLLLLSAVPADAGLLSDGGLSAHDGGFVPLQPSTWTLPARLPPGSADREALIAALTADAGLDPRAVGETPLSRAEAEALLLDPRAALVYAEKTISVVAPSMVKRHRQEHLDVTALFLSPERVDAGVQFLAAHAPALDAAFERHGVDPEAVVAILMWETRLGTITGDWLTFNALASQAFFAHAASAVAMSRPEERQLTDEASQARRARVIAERGLRNLVALCRQAKTRGIDPFTVKGSWAGAVGFPQFMPASLRWAEDGDGDARIDLFTFPDAIASVARYLGEHGYRKDRRKAVWGYNHEDAYVAGVLAYADAVRGPAPDGGPRR